MVKIIALQQIFNQKHQNFSTMKTHELQIIATHH
ncbi:MAG: ComC/BlpC family leader-containing pheromone/bacteriocin [Rhizobiaceae bacterium]|nr:ComC/BlpC family leader-containing pheromone/bacteriocin [Rhizobiaceae bacterium]